MSRHEKKLKDKLEDEIKFAGLEALVPEELEKHLILNSTRLRTFEDACLEVVTYVEAKFGSSIRDSTPSDTVTRGPPDPMDLDAVNSLSSQKRNSASSQRDGCLKCSETLFQRDCEANRASHGPRVRAKECGREEGEIQKKLQRFQKCHRFVRG